MDLVRVTRYDGSVSLYVPLRSIRAYHHAFSLAVGDVGF